MTDKTSKNDVQVRPHDDQRVDIVFDVPNNTVTIHYPRPVDNHTMHPETARRFGQAMIKAANQLREANQHGTSRPSTRWEPPGEGDAPDESATGQAETNGATELDGVRPAGQTRQPGDEEREPEFETPRPTSTESGSDGK